MRKRIMITGEKGYIGTHLQQWLLNHPALYDVAMLNVRTDAWRQLSFRGVDVLVHAAGIVHQPGITDWMVYQKTNIDLTLALAQKAKSEGVRQFIFLSTMAVYGRGKRLTVNEIDEATVCQPDGMYGKSKYLAEQAIQMLQSDDFQVVIVRPPNVYGKGCKGGYISSFQRVVARLPAIPDAYPNVRQSTIYIDNLCELIRLIIDDGSSGCFMPQDKKAVSAVELMAAIADGMGRQMRKSRLLGLGIQLLSFLPLVKKAYGGVAYTECMTACFGNVYVLVPFAEGIRRTIGHG